MLNKLPYIFLFSILIFLSSCKDNGGKKPDKYDVWGIDISKHQADVDLGVVLEKEKPNFVFVKATEGTLIYDNMYDKNRAALEKSNVLWGAYHFFGHRTSGKEQAQNFIKIAKLKKGNLIPVLDIEQHRFFKSQENMVREVKAFCKEIKKEYGVNPILYCSMLFYEKHLMKDFPQNDYVLWIADYRGNPDLSWHFWQHTDSHKVKGIKGKVDRNVFAGSYDDLKKLILK